MSVIKHKEQRVGIFIDAQNLYHSGKNLYHSKVNFGAIVKDALDGRKLVRAVAYVIARNPVKRTAFSSAHKDGHRDQGQRPADIQLGRKES